MMSITSQLYASVADWNQTGGIYFRQFAKPYKISPEFCMVSDSISSISPKTKFLVNKNKEVLEN